MKCSFHFTTVSVPSSSGNQLQPCAPAILGRHVSCFSPLLIGEPTATISPHPLDNQTSAFQSPPHRGTNCNRFSSCPSAPPPHVSVPSSSGNQLQRGHVVSSSGW